MGRPDMLYLFLASLGLALHLRYVRTQAIGWHIATVTAVLLAFFAKQSAVLVALMIGVSTLLSMPRSKWPAAILSAIALAAAAAGVSFVFAGTGVTWHLVRGVSNGIDVRSMIREAWLPFIAHQALILGAWMPALAWSVHASLDRRELRALAAMSIVALLGGAVLSLKWGSAANYFNEFVVVSAILVPVWLSRIAIRDRTSTPRTLAGMPAVFAALVAVVSLATQLNAVDGLRLANTYDSQAKAQDIERQFLKPGDMLMSTDPQLALIMPDRVVFPQWDVALAVAAAGKFDLAPVQAFVRQHPTVAVVSSFYCDPHSAASPGMRGRLYAAGQGLLGSMRMVGYLNKTTCVLRSPAE